MNTSDSDTSSRSGRLGDPWRPLRYAVRIPLVSLHLLISLPFTVLIVLSIGRHLQIAGERLDHRLIRWWSGTLIRLFGMRIQRRGEPLPGAVMFVANHLSWLDIELMHSQRMMHFVAKAEIGGWPLVGWLARQGGTIYHRRGSTESLSGVREQMLDTLRRGIPVAVFPEGGTTRGDGVRVFHGRLFQAAIECEVPVQPVALRYLQDGRSNAAIPFAEGESFFGNFVRVLGEPTTIAEVSFLEPLRELDSGRRRLAEQSRQRIREHLGFAEHD